MVWPPHKMPHESYVAKAYREEFLKSKTARQATHEMDHPAVGRHGVPYCCRRAQSIGQS